MSKGELFATYVLPVIAAVLTAMAGYVGVQLKGLCQKYINDKTKPCPGVVGWNPLTGSVAAWKSFHASISMVEVNKPTQEASVAKTDIAKHRSAAYRRTWTVKVDPDDQLMMRTGAGTDKDILAKLDNGVKFVCYGYYNKDKTGAVWLYGIAGGKTGYCSKNYLK